MTESKEGCKNCKHRWNSNNYCPVINMEVDTDNGWCNKFNKRNTDGVSIIDMLEDALSRHTTTSHTQPTTTRDVIQHPSTHTQLIGEVTTTNHTTTPSDVADNTLERVAYAIARGELPPIPAPPRRTTRYYLCPECSYSDVASAWDRATDEYYNGNIGLLEESSVGYNHVCPNCRESIQYENIEILEV